MPKVKSDDVLARLWTQLRRRRSIQHPIASFKETTLLTWLLARSWWFVYTPFAILEIRLLWEQTWLTWTRGSQMIGFWLIHVHPGLTILGFLGFAGTVLWVLLTVCLLAVRRHTLLTAGKVQLCVSIGTIVLAMLPIDGWVLRLTTER